MNIPESGPGVHEDDWAAAVNSATDHVRQEEVESRSQSWRKTRQATHLVLMGIVVSVVVGLATPEVIPTGPAPLSRLDQASDLRAEAALLIEQIEAVKAETGSLPSPELLAPFLDEGYEYEIVDASSGRYVVRRVAGEATVTYDGTLPLGLWLLLGS